ncbi:MAG: hypothetical protein QM714_13950 [Nocardioides sp.]|uniref:SDR family NAD(P)-dependent oxidoreductase n=1 Tax=Nocardioides sp. TaxID=35761 RepID=UPI0039E5C972
MNANHFPSTNHFNCRGKVFVVTGGGNGIGRAVVLGLLRRGAEVADRMSSHVVDISDRAAVAALPDAVLSRHGRVDGLLNVAGVIQRFVPFAELRGTPVAVTVVFPGGVATHIADNSGPAAPGAGDNNAEVAAKLATPQYAAQQIIDGMERGSYRVVIGKDAAMTDKFSRIAPQRATDTIAKKMASLLS